jgi:hypothetical protein
MLVNNINDSLNIRFFTLAVNDSKGTSQYALRVTESHSNPLIANIKTQATRDIYLQAIQAQIKLLTSFRASSNLSLYLPPA